MKKLFLITLAVAVSLCLPLTAQAKTEFELGGYIRLDAMWISQQTNNYALAGFNTRDNTPFGNHGKFMMNANATRFNFTIKGPELWGGKVTGFIEADFDGQMLNVNPNNGTTTATGSFNQAVLRLRHAMFKITWPEREVLFGQYWSVNSEMIPDVADSGAFCLFGATQFRLAQVRYTQKFGEYFDASVEVGSGQNGRWGLNLNSAYPLEGETSESPMVEAKLRYEQDLYGKAGWYGKPRGFYVGLGGGWFRTFNQSNNPYALYNTLGTNNFFPAAGQALNLTTRNDYGDHWLALIENFLPIIPTRSKSLAGTMSLAHQWWIGQGVSAWRLDLPANDRFYTWNGAGNNTAANPLSYTQQFIKRYGGWAQLQYYWTEEIYTNLNFGFEKAFGFNGMQRNNFLPGLAAFAGQPGFVYLNGVNIDPVNSSWRAGITQWYRPIPAVKFALQYTYMRTNYFQSLTAGSNTTNFGNCHSILANAWYMF